MTAAEVAQWDAQAVRPSNRKEMEKAQKEAEKAERRRKVAEAAARVSHSQPKMLNRVLASPIAKTNMLLLYKKAILWHSTTISAHANYPSMV